MALVTARVSAAVGADRAVDPEVVPGQVVENVGLENRPLAGSVLG